MIEIQWTFFFSLLKYKYIVLFDFLIQFAIYFVFFIDFFNFI